MHDFSSVVQEFYTDYRFTGGKELSVRLGQFKNSYSMQNPLSPTKLDLIDCYSQSVLYLAVENGDEDAVKLILENCANNDDAKPEGLSPVVAAIMKRNRGNKILLLFFVK
jgi:hypothetical protein